MQGEPAGLPLLSFTLLKLWEMRADAAMKFADDQALGGNPREILANSATKVYEALIRNWDRLADWVKASFAEQTNRKAFTLRAQKWNDGTLLTFATDAPDGFAVQAGDMAQTVSTSPSELRSWKVKVPNYSDADLHTLACKDHGGIITADEREQNSLPPTSSPRQCAARTTAK